MKIHSNDEILTRLHPERTCKDITSPDVDFGNILKQKIENSTAVNGGIQSTALTSTVHPAQLKAMASQDITATVERIESFLKLLDEYCGKLGDSRVSLKDIYPVISEIDKQKESLIPLLDSLSDVDELRHILNQTLITASLEVIKFNKGEYITP
jgi:hypothetical protein